MAQFTTEEVKTIFNTRKASVDLRKAKLCNCDKPQGGTTPTYLLVGYKSMEDTNALVFTVEGGVPDCFKRYAKSAEFNPLGPFHTPINWVLKDMLFLLYEI